MRLALELLLVTERKDQLHQWFVISPEKFYQSALTVDWSAGEEESEGGLWRTEFLQFYIVWLYPDSVVSKAVALGKLSPLMDINPQCKMKGRNTVDVVQRA